MLPPFSLSPNPTLMYTPPALVGSLEKIRFMIAERQGLALLVGDNGLGKSTLLRYLEAEYSSEGHKTAMLLDTELASPFAFLRALCAQFGIEAKRSGSLQRRVLELFLLEQFRDGQTVVLFIDEGQRLSPDMLETIRALLNLETDVHKLLQIVLAGTLELRDRILGKKYKGLRSRVFAPCILSAMMPDEIAAMIEFRCRRANMPNPFEWDAVRDIALISSGIPRSALLLCSHSWNMAKRLKLSRVPADLVRAVREEVNLEADSAPAVAEAVTA